jgi:two-component system nitrate/nitrite response regulator NarL
MSELPTVNAWPPETGMPERSTVRVLIVDDHPIFRTGLKHLLETVPGMVVVGEAADARQALAQMRLHRPDVLLLDIVMPGPSGLEVLTDLLSRSTSTRVVLLTAAIDAQESLRALQLGAAGILLKNAALTDIVRCVQAVVAGRYWVGGEAFQSLVGSLARGAPAQETPPRAFGLTARELEVVSLVATGAGNRDIATQLGLSEETVKHHLSKIFDKTGQSSRVELALFALQTGLVGSDA